MNSEVWCFIEPGRGNEIATEIARLGEQTGSVTCGVVVGKVGKDLAPELGQYGITKLYAVEPSISNILSPEDYAYLVTHLIKKSPPYVCLFAASPLGNEVAVRVAVRLGAGLITWCIDLNFISGKLIATKKAYDGKASKRIAWQCPPPYLVTVAPEVMEAIPAEKVHLPVIQEERFSLPPSKVELVGQVRLGWRDMPLTEAIGVLGVGAGIKDSTGMSLIKHLAELLNMPVGGTKRADEMGLVPRECRIGASGFSIEPNVYIAIGISGASHHMVGTRKVKHVVAINKDKAAPIFDIAELGIVDDFNPVVTSIIKQWKRGTEYDTPTENAG